MCFLKKNNIWSSLNHIDRWLLFGAVLALLVSGNYIFDNYFQKRLAEENILDNSKTDYVGTVTNYTNDTRYKPSLSFNWSKANKTQKIYQSDSIFVGEKSKADVLLNDKSQLAIGENSLVVFNKIQRQDLADLKLGNFSLKVDGNVKLAIQGEIVEIKGSKTNVQIFIDKNKKKKPIIKTVVGKATVQYRQQTVELQANEVLPVALPPPIATSVPVPKNQGMESYVHHWKLYDLYKLNGDQLVKKESLPGIVQLQHKIQWLNISEKQQNAFVMIGDDKDFIQNFKTIETQQTEFEFREAFVGKNYWRISYDQQNWSSIRELNILAQLREEKPQLTLPKQDLTFYDKPIFAQLQMDSDEAVKGYVLELSPLNTFVPNSTNVVFTKTELTKIRIDGPGTLYARARRVYVNDELSDYSEAVRIESHQGRILSKIIVKPKRIVKKVEPKKIVKQVAVEVENRKPTSQETQVFSPLKKPEEFLNDPIRKSGQIEFELSSFIASSTDQKFQGESPSSAVGGGLSYSNWFNSENGMRAYLKTKVADISGTSVGAPTLMGALYLRRLPSFEWLGRTQTAALIGLENYTNKGSRLYSPQYSLLKVGGTVMLPIGYRWGAGADAIFGYGFEQSKRYELSARMQYYFNRRVSIGFGYRLFMFEAGSQSTSPTNLPYREIFEEGYSSFGYQF